MGSGGCANCHLPACPFQVSIGRYREDFVDQGITRGIKEVYLDRHPLLKGYTCANSSKGGGGLLTNVALAGSACGWYARPTLAFKYLEAAAATRGKACIPFLSSFTHHI
jgi:hypothetical protein